MFRARRTIFALSVLLGLCVLFGPGHARGAPSQANPQPATPGQVSRSVGTIKTINGNVITLTPDAGSEINVAVQDTTRVVRIPPGETTLKNATPIQLQDLQAGDRVLVAGRLGDDVKTVNALTIVVMKGSDLAAKHQHDLEDWQKRGVRGVVKAVDPASGTVTISVPALSGSKAVTIRTTKNTIVLRYAPDSVRFEDAKPAVLADIKDTDQLRARGSRSADGNEVDAEAILFGSFGSINSTFLSADSTANTITVLDLATKKPVQVRVTAQSLLRKLSAPEAQQIAMYQKIVSGGAAAASGDHASSPTPSAQATGGAAEHPHMRGSPDVQQIVLKAPAFTVADLKKGDALTIIFSTQGAVSEGITAIQMVAGVEAILQASPKGSQGMILSAWSLGGGGGDAESQ